MNYSNTQNPGRLKCILDSSGLLEYRDCLDIQVVVALILNSLHQIRCVHTYNWNSSPRYGCAVLHATSDDRGDGKEELYRSRGRGGALFGGPDAGSHARGLLLRVGYPSSKSIYSVTWDVDCRKRPEPGFLTGTRSHVGSETYFRLTGSC